MPSSDWYKKRFAAGVPARETDVSPAYPTAAPSQAQPATAHYQRPTLSSLQTDHCPACVSTNYMAAPGTQFKRCFDCGYPVVQAGTGVGGAASDGTVHKATQVAGSGFNPTVIVGRVQ